jgi:hypothetical protein
MADESVIYSRGERLRTAEVIVTDERLKTLLGADPVDATVSLTVSGQPVADDTITLDEEVFTFKASSANENQITIGANKAATQANIRTILNAHSSGKFDIAAFASDVAVITYIGSTGTGGNGKASTESATNVTLSAATFTGGVEEVEEGIVLIEVPARKVVSIVNAIVQSKIVDAYTSGYSDIKVNRGDADVNAVTIDGSLFTTEGDNERAVTSADGVISGTNVILRNTGDNNIAGGNAANKLKVTITYVILDKLT